MAQPENTARYKPGPARDHSEPGTFNPYDGEKFSLPLIGLDVPLYVEPQDAANLRAMLKDIGRRVGFSAPESQLDGPFCIVLQGNAIGIAKIQ